MSKSKESAKIAETENNRLWVDGVGASHPHPEEPAEIFPPAPTFPEGCRVKGETLVGSRGNAPRKFPISKIWYNLLYQFDWRYFSCYNEQENKPLEIGMKGVLRLAHMMKLTRGAVGHMAKHYERARGENGEYVKFGNQDIDQERTHLNYNLAEHQAKRQGEFIKQRCEEVHCLNRKDINVACSWVVTLPKDFEEENQDAEIGDFFRGTYQFLEKRYGKENVVSAYVHMDEVTPHMHFCFVPIVEDKKKDRLKVSAKECVNRKDLQTFHKDLQYHLWNEHELDCNVLNGATANGNKTVQELKAETLESINETEMEHIEELTKQVESLMDTVNELEINKSELLESRSKLHTDVLSLQGDKNTLENEIDGLKGQIRGLKTKLDEGISSLKSLREQGKSTIESINRMINERSQVAVGKGVSMSAMKERIERVRMADFIEKSGQKDSFQRFKSNPNMFNREKGSIDYDKGR